MVGLRQTVGCVGLCALMLGACGTSRRNVEGEPTASNAGAGMGGAEANGGAGAGSAAAGGAGASSGGGAGNGHAGATATNGGAAATGANLGAGTGGGGDAGEMNAAGAPPATNADAETLQHCAGSAPCDRSLVQLVENSSREIDGPTRCVLASLAARTPGRYEHETVAAFSNGSTGATHYLVVNEDGSVLYARVPHQLGAGQPPLPPDPGQRCTLKPASYFEDCAQAVDAAATAHPVGDVAWHCAFGTGDSSTPSTLEWFESCSLESPLACESG